MALIVATWAPILGEMTVLAGEMSFAPSKEHTALVGLPLRCRQPVGTDAVARRFRLAGVDKQAENHVKGWR